MTDYINGPRPCDRCGVMSPHPSEDKSFSDWIVWHIVRMACEKKA